MHPLPDFALERYFARWEFDTPLLLCSSDVEGYPMQELLALADDESRAMWETLTLGYTESRGHPLLREAIASLYTGVSPDEVLTFAGAEEAIYITMRLLLGPGDHAVVTWPGYQSLYEVARGQGAEVTLLPLRDDGSRWMVDLDELRAALRPTTRLLVVNFPHNPTGALPTASEWAAIRTLAAERGVQLFADEVYRGLEYDAADRLSAAVEADARAISLGVMSKAFALAGLRIGWLATHDHELLRRAAAYKDYTTICSSAPSEILALIALRNREAVLRRSLEIIRSNLGHLDAFFAAFADAFAWRRPRAGSIAFPELLAPIGIDAFAGSLRAAEGVLLLPASLYGYPANHFRIGFGRNNLPTALEGLARFARAQGLGS